MIERFGLGFRARRLRLGLWARWSSCARAVGHKCVQHISLFGYLGMLIEVEICTVRNATSCSDIWCRNTMPMLALF